ncbi:MAG: hypothetical protein GKR89_22035 [Candidatus Latescibacteria bacterium]|nr:hypothetical protein [Candidatus Latescibacterota bacterium]
MTPHSKWNPLALVLLLIAQTGSAQIAFEEVTHQRGIHNPGNAESVWLDYNNDGHLDLITDI